MAFTLPKLSYPYNALEPYIDAKTMEIHHTKHHQAYTDKLNAALEKAPSWQNKKIEEIVQHINDLPAEIKTAVRNHGGGYANHCLFWETMGPDCGGEPKGDVGEAIKKTFGGFDKFKEQFSAAAANQFGSGWAWLACDKEKLVILSTPNQDTPLMDGKKPLLGLDVWEHAYYLKYQNKRPDYIAAWWNVVNWVKVNEIFLSGKPTAAR